MAAPTPYVPAYDFSAWQVANPADPLPGDKADIEFAAVQDTTDDLIANLALVQRSDGALVNGIVTPDSLSASTKALLAAGGAIRGAWATATSYALGDVVTNAGATWINTTAHTSGTFSTDKAAGKWIQLATVPVVLDFLEFGGSTTPSADNSATFDAAVAYCAANGLRRIHFRGVFPFTAAPSAIATSLILSGDGPYSHGLLRNYTPDAATDAFLDFTAAYSGVQGLDLAAADGTSTGYAVNCVVGSGGGVSWLVFRDMRVLADQRSSVTGSWTRGLHFDGNANASGIRDIHCHNVNVFDCTDTTATIYLRKGVVCDFIGGGLYSGTNGAGAQKMLITGSSGNVSHRIQIEGMRVVGAVNVEWASGCGGSFETDSGLTIDSNSVNCAFFLSNSTTVTNASTSSIVIANNQIYTAAAAGLVVHGVGATFQRDDGLGVIVGGQRGDAHGDSQPIANFVAYGESDAAAQVQYATLVGYAVQDADGAEYGRWLVQCVQNGVNTTIATFGQGLAVGSGATEPGVGKVNATTEYQVNGTKVVGAQQAHIADASTSHAVSGSGADAAINAALDALGAKINAILLSNETHGLNASS